MGRRPWLGWRVSRDLRVASWTGAEGFSLGHIAVQYAKAMGARVIGIGELPVVSVAKRQTLGTSKRSRCPAELSIFLISRRTKTLPGRSSS